MNDGETADLMLNDQKHVFEMSLAYSKHPSLRKKSKRGISQTLLSSEAFI